MSGVVVGVDDSETALHAARRAAAIASSLGESLHLVMAVKPGHSGTIRHGSEEFFEDWTQEAKQSLQRIRLDLKVPDATIAIGEKDPAKAICAEAAKFDASLIVVGNRRVQSAKRVLGTVANDVLRLAPCDVLVVQTMGAVAAKDPKSSTSHRTSSADLFRWATADQRRRIDQLATSVQVSAGTVLTTQGQIGREFGVLLDGSATVTVDGEVVATLRAGDHFGEMALLEAAGVGNDLRSATVTTDTDLWIGVMSVHEFRTLLAEFPEIAEQLRASTADRAAAIRD